MRIPSRRPDGLWMQLVARVPPDALPVIRAAFDRFWLENGRRPMSDPVAYGLFIEMLCADYLAGPESPCAPPEP